MRWIQTSRVLSLPSSFLESAAATLRHYLKRAAIPRYGRPASDSLLQAGGARTLPR